MCLCRSERTSFTNGNLKGSINAGRYTADYLQCGNLPYLAWKNAHNCAGLSYRRIRRYLVWRLKRLEARDFSRVRIKFLIHDLDYEELTDYRKLYKYLKKRLIDGKMTYIFLDEVQNVTDFPKVLDSLYIKNLLNFWLSFHKLVNADISRILGLYRYFLFGRYLA